MRWLRRRPRPETEADLPVERLEEAREARQAREASEKALREVRARWPEVTEVAASLRRHRERNGFREMFERALRDDHGTATR